MEVLIAAGEITLDHDTGCASVFGRRIALTRKEFAALERRMVRQDAGDDAQDLLDQAWSEHADPFDTTTRVTMMTLRRKLGRPNDDGLAGVREPRTPKPGPASGGATYPM